MGDWKMEPAALTQASWTDLTSGKVVATTDVLCAGGAGSCLDNFVVSLAVAHMVQGVVRVEKSPTTSHWPVRLTLKGTTWGHNVLARQRTSPFQEEPFEWTWETPGSPNKLELAWLKLLREAEAEWCRIHDL